VWKGRPTVPEAVDGSRVNRFETSADHGLALRIVLGLVLGPVHPQMRAYSSVG
jgi:hypothetical protein